MSTIPVSSTPCINFEDFGTCRYGAECRFAHVARGGGGGDRKPKPNNRECRFGDKCGKPDCSFVHSGRASAPASSPSGSPSASAASASAGGSSSRGDRSGAGGGRETRADRGLIPCSFGTKCTKRDCGYLHPQGQSPTLGQQPKQQQQQQQQPASSPSAAGSGQQQPSQKRTCRFGAECARSDCGFIHPAGFVPGSKVGAAASPSSSPKQPAPASSPSSAASQPSQKRTCRFEAECSRADCGFIHPAGFVPGSKAGAVAAGSPSSKPAAAASSPASGSAGRREKAPRGDKSEPRPCKFGARCPRAECRFVHPAGWDAAQIKREQHQAEAAAAAAAAAQQAPAATQ